MTATPEALERLGDHLWHAAVDLLFLESPESEPEAWRLNSNRQMIAWCRHLGLVNPSGAAFEIHVARVFLADGFAAVENLLATLKDVSPQSLKHKKVIWGYRDGEPPRRLAVWQKNKMKLMERRYVKTGWTTLVLPVGEAPPPKHPDSTLKAQP